MAGCCKADPATSSKTGLACVQGDIPPEWGAKGAFPKLQKAHLGGNQLRGVLPPMHEGAMPVLEVSTQHDIRSTAAVSATLGKRVDGRWDPTRHSHSCEEACLPMLQACCRHAVHRRCFLWPMCMLSCCASVHMHAVVNILKENLYPAGTRPAVEHAAWGHPHLLDAAACAARAVVAPWQLPAVRVVAPQRSLLRVPGGRHRM